MVFRHFLNLSNILYVHMACKFIYLVICFTIHQNTFQYLFNNFIPVKNFFLIDCWCFHRVDGLHKPLRGRLNPDTHFPINEFLQSPVLIHNGLEAARKRFCNGNPIGFK